MAIRTLAIQGNTPSRLEWVLCLKESEIQSTKINLNT